MEIKMEKQKAKCICGEDECQDKVLARIIGHGTPKEWHNMSHGFFLRVVEYCYKTKADLQVQVQKTHAIYPRGK
jgi:hypothetical protein